MFFQIQKFKQARTEFKISLNTKVFFLNHFERFIVMQIEVFRFRFKV